MDITGLATRAVTLTIPEGNLILDPELKRHPITELRAWSPFYDCRNKGREMVSCCGCTMYLPP